MSGLQVVGALLIAAPFVAILSVCQRAIGWRGLFVVVGCTVVIAAFTLAGAVLLTGGL